MTRTKKYGIKVEVDQFGNQVPQGWEDPHEKPLIDWFDNEVSRVIFNKPNSTFVELGSDQAYYTSLFNAISNGKHGGIVCVEPSIGHIPRTQRTCEINNIKATIINAAIGTKNYFFDASLDVPSITLMEVAEKLGGFIDVLHCDIDGGESEIIKHQMDVFERGLVGLAFFLTHRGIGPQESKYETHEAMKMAFSGLNYDLMCELTGWKIAGDNLLIYKLRK